MPKLRITLTAFALAGMSLLVAAPAQAESVTTSCNAGVDAIKPWKLNAGGTYIVSGANHTWLKATYTLTGPLLGGSNNVNIRLRHAENREIAQNNTRWSWDSPDNREGDVAYERNINTTVPASENEYLKFHAIFDLPASPDPSCVAYTDFV